MISLLKFSILRSFNSIDKWKYKIKVSVDNSGATRDTKIVALCPNFRTSRKYMINAALLIAVLWWWSETEQRPSATGCQVAEQFAVDTIANAIAA